MKRQARPFVVETKRSRKAPANLWASTPLLQQELAAASAEPKAETVFAVRAADKAGQRPAEPARRILPSLVAEVPSPVLDALASEEAEEAESSRRRIRPEDDETAAPPARRGRPRRVADVAEADAPAETFAAPARAREPAARKTAALKPAAAETLVAKTAASKAQKTKPGVASAVGPVAIVTPDVPTAALAAGENTPAGSRQARSRAARSPAGAALLPGERWKRRLPQRLW